MRFRGQFFEKLGRTTVLTWLAVFATMLLGIELYLSFNSVWNQLDTITKAIIFVITFIIVLILGYKDSGPSRGLMTKGRQ